MKKKILWILLIAFFMIPNVWAEELPREGVTYFLNYPNGEEEVVENYEDAIKENEKLIYEGTTNSVGEVILDNWDRVGKLRIVQEVPNGYLTNTQELTIDLSDESTAQFVNYKGTNPKTGNYFIDMIVVLTIIGIAFLFTKKKKAWIPVFLFFFLATTVKADSDIVITVKDDKGNALSNVKVYVYATPTSVEAYPAVKLLANGGKFYDGKEIMYIKIPYDNCTLDDIYYYLSPSGDAPYEMDNIFGVTREHYLPAFNPPANYHNGMEVSIDWEENSEAELVTVHANGGYIDFHGQKLENVRFYKADPNVENKMMESLRNEGKRSFGLDVNTSCSNYNENNSYILKETPDSDDLYACWEDIEDGIYVNHMKFITSPDVCFDNPNFTQLNNNDFQVTNGNEFSLIINANNGNFGIGGNGYNYEVMSTVMEVYYQKKMVVSIKNNEISRNSGQALYTITNLEKQQLFKTYTNLYINDNCLTATYADH